MNKKLMEIFQFLHSKHYSYIDGVVGRGALYLNFSTGLNGRGDVIELGFFEDNIDVFIDAHFASGKKKHLWTNLPTDDVLPLLQKELE